MKPSLTIAIPALALSAVFSAHAAEKLAPTAVTDLYMRTIVNHDEAAIKQLNDYLRPDRLRSGRSADFANAAELKEADKTFPGEIAEMALPLFPEAVRAELKTPVENLMSTVLKARRGSECKAVSAADPVEDEHGILTSEVTFECLLVKTDETWAQGIQRLAKSNCSAQQCSDDLKTLQNAYAKPASFTYRGTFGVSMVPKDKNVAWRNDFPRETFDEMFNAF